MAGALVDPGVEGGRLANVEPPHTLRRHLFLVLIHPDHSGDGNDRRAYRLPDEPAARIADSRADQGRDAEDEQVKRPRHQLDDDEDEARDQPGKGNVHGARKEDTGAPMLPQASKPGTDHGFSRKRRALEHFNLQRDIRAGRAGWRPPPGSESPGSPRSAARRTRISARPP